MPTEPRFRQLARENLLTAPTLAALQTRESVVEGEPRYLAPEAFDTLVQLCDRLRPPYERPTAREIALRIDAQLADEKTDGWRYDAMPPDGEAHAMGLAALAAEANDAGGLTDDLIRSLQRGETRLQWAVSPERFLEEVLAEVVTYAYSQPEAQDAIGYDGYADAQGWDHIRIGDSKEPWE